MKAAAIYARISSDREGTRAGVTRQIDDCRQWADRHGAVVAEVYVDNDVSAYGGKPRPGYRRMCEDIKAGTRDGVITWHMDRLHRRPIELEEFIVLIEATGTQVVTVTGGEYDLSTSDGRAMARVVGAFARKESEDKSRRIRRQALEQAKQGRRSGGGSRPYGYTPDHRTLVAKEAAIVKEAAERVLAGETLRSVCVDLNERSVPTVSGRPWSTTVLRTILMSGRISGQREHHGEIVAKGDWPNVVTPAVSARLRSMLGDPTRRTNRSPRRYPLTGLVRCALCGAKMVARPRDDGRRRYVCARGPGFSGCGHIHTLAEPVEALISEGVLYRLDTPDLSRALLARFDRHTESETIEHELAEDRAQLEELAAMYGRKEISALEWAAAKSPIQQRLVDAERRLRSLTNASALDGYVGNSSLLRSQWDGLSPARQRAIIAALCDSVTIGPAQRGRNIFDPARVTVTWKV